MWPRLNAARHDDHLARVNPIIVERYLTRIAKGELLRCDPAPLGDDGFFYPVRVFLSFTAGDCLHHCGWRTGRRWWPHEPMPARRRLMTALTAPLTRSGPAERSGAHDAGQGVARTGRAGDVAGSGAERQVSA